MLNRTLSFKKSSRAVTAVAAIGMFVSASVMATGPASAQVVNASPCDSIKNSTAAIKCEYMQADKRIKANEARGAAADARGAAADARAASSQSVIDCVQFLTAGVKSGMFAKTEILQKADGKLNDANACLVARRFGFGRKAEATPAVRLN